MTQPRAGVALTVAALLFVLVAAQSAIKPFLSGPDVGFMLLGVRTDGLVEAIAARVHAAVMLLLAYGVWRLRRYALWFLYFYTPYVLLNLVLFISRYELHPPAGVFAPLFAAIYSLIALGVPGGTAYLLARRRQELS